mgnify:CR=1 FL=1
MCYFSYGRLLSSNSITSTLTLITPNFVDVNYMVGMSDFNFVGTRFKFSTTIGATITVSSTMTYNSLNY